MWYTATITNQPSATLKKDSTLQPIKEPIKPQVLAITTLLVSPTESSPKKGQVFSQVLPKLLDSMIGEIGTQVQADMSFLSIEIKRLKAPTSLAPIHQYDNFSKMK